VQCYIDVSGQPKAGVIKLSYIAPTASASAATSAAGAVANRASSETVLALVLAELEDNKAEDVITIDLTGRSAIADAMVIASARSTRQVSAIAQKVTDALKERFRITARCEGKDVGDWVLIDTGDVVVHLFRPEVRAFYQLEKMWQPGDAAG